MNDISTSAMTQSSEPTTGKILYLPVREIIWPEMIAPTIRPAVNGISSRPASVGETPRTICR